MTSATADSTATGSRDPSYEARLPSWQQRLNRFAENWIFAFIVAMAVRHFGLEAFRIPTASMEPMLYGDQAFRKSDHVVVDKLLFRFQSVKRWGVTVFQYPLPEIEVNGEAQSAIDGDGSRLDKPFIRPLMYRNFVKRAVILPKDVFYLANGDVFIKGEDGKFQIARKPTEVQEALWEEIYRHGAQKGYLPWLGTAGSATGVKQDGQLSFMLGGGAIVFSQPLRNLYVKPGLVDVQRSNGSGGQKRIETAMTAPVFDYANDQKGNIWNLDEWTITRLTSADMDDPRRATQLNGHMKEFVGDIRIVADIAALTGDVNLRLSEGKQQVFDLQLKPIGWTLMHGDRQLASGSDRIVGNRVSMTNVDDQIIVTIGGREGFRGDVPAVDPFPVASRTRVEWLGNGTVDFSLLSIQRDVHYSNNGFLRDERENYATYTREVRQLQGLQGRSAAQEDRLQDALRKLHDLGRMVIVRAQILGMPVESLTNAQKYGPIASSESTAVTAPANGYLMLGDNSPLSFDGRNWGWVPEMNLRGRVLAVVLPFSRWRAVR